MAKFKRIVMATDFSSASEPAFEEAARMAREWGARLYLVHAYETPAQAPVPLMPVSNFFEVLAAARAQVERRLQDLMSRESLRGVDVRPLAERGGPVHAIVDAAVRENADLIIMGTRGRRGAARFLLGSVATGVIAIAPCPVLTLRSQTAAATHVA
jgi:nucleotide-binding universal stress UspA family protein